VFGGIGLAIIFFHKAILLFYPTTSSCSSDYRPSFRERLARSAFSIYCPFHLDGGCLALLAFEEFSGQQISNQKHLIKAGSWVIAALTASVTVLFLMQIIGGASS
jgi:hypothetical protein